MKLNIQKTERIHALDSLRAIMMMLGIVLHTTITYMGGEPSSGWPMRDPNASSLFQEWLLYIIHVFRMPIFMIVAGFFAALLFYERSPNQMLNNRIKRIVLPFVVSIVILWPLCILAFSYSNEVFSWSTTFDSPFAMMFVNTSLQTFKDLSAFVPQRTMHLWFLYYLIMFSLASYLLASVFNKLPSVTAKVTTVFQFIIKNPLLKLVLFTVLTYGLLQVIDKKTSFKFVPDLNTFVFYFYFYGFGWVLYHSKELLPTFLKHDWLFTILGVIIYSAYFLFGSLGDVNFHPEVKTLVNVCCLWLFIFGMTGLFLRYACNHSPTMRYVSDSSYWVFLIHLPLTALIPGLIAEWQVPVFLKFAVVVSLTTIICFTTYHYLVRSTFIGKFLNGRKYPRKFSNS